MGREITIDDKVNVQPQYPGKEHDLPSLPTDEDRVYQSIFQPMNDACREEKVHLNKSQWNELIHYIVKKCSKIIYKNQKQHLLFHLHEYAKVLEAAQNGIMFILGLDSEEEAGQPKPSANKPLNYRFYIAALLQLVRGRRYYDTFRHFSNVLLDVYAIENPPRKLFNMYKELHGLKEKGEPVSIDDAVLEVAASDNMDKIEALLKSFKMESMHLYEARYILKVINLYEN